MSKELEYLKKIDTKEDLESEELERMVLNYEIECSYGDNCRWTRAVYSICQLKDRYFMIEWEEGLTECQPNEFFEQPYEVCPHTYEKTIEVTDWIKK